MTNLFSTKKQNAVAVTELLLKALNVRVSSGTIKQTLEDHPDFPSVLSIHDSLIDWGLECDTYNVIKEEYNIDELLFPFIAHVKVDGGEFILVNKIENGAVYYTNEKGIYGRKTEEDFLKQWTYIALHATPKINSGEKAYQINNLIDKFNAIKIPLLIITLLILVYLNIEIKALNVGYSALLLLKLIGLATSILLLMHSINANNPLIQNLCSLGKRNNCNAILKSDAAKFTSWLTWSEVGFFYFAGSFLSLIFAPSSLFLLAWLNILALPYTVYSVTYQYKNKNWCVLCCTVQAILVLEFFVFTFGLINFSLWSFSFSLSYVYFFLSFLIPILLWATAKTFLLKAQQLTPLKNQLKKFKYNTELFHQVLKAQPKYGIDNDLMPIVLGNPNAETVITMVSNPFCGPCAQAHQVLDEWLSYRDDIQIKILFSTADHDDDQKTKVSRHISALSLLNDAALVEKALNDWYSLSSKKYEEWAKRYPVELSEKLAQVTAKQKAWCELTEITSTPTILVNGYKLPVPYRLEDIRYLLS